MTAVCFDSMSLIFLARLFNFSSSATFLIAYRTGV
jgi:hypothetical protein